MLPFPYGHPLRFICLDAGYFFVVKLYSMSLYNWWLRQLSGLYCSLQFMQSYMGCIPTGPCIIPDVLCTKQQ